jgi:hypothetical protein
MKYTSTLVFLLAAGPAIAQQPSRTPSAKHFMHERMSGIVSEILEQQATSYYNAASKTTAMVPRMVAHSYRNAGQLISDSTRYFYSSPHRGAFHNPKNPLSYHDYFQPVVFSPLHGGDNGYLFRRQYIQHDSMQVWVRSGTSFSINGRSNYRYNSSNQPTEYEENWSTTGFVGIGHLLGYNAVGQNNYAQRLWDFSNGPTPNYTVAANQYTTYDAAGRVLVDSQTNDAGIPTVKFVYSYVSGGLLKQIDEVDLTSLDTVTRFSLTYNTAGLLVKSLSEESMGGMWYQWSMDSFAYSGSNPSYTYYGGFGNPHGNGLSLSYKMELHLNSAGEWDTVRYYNYNDTIASWLLDRQEAIVYNAAANWDRRYYYGDANNDNIPDAQPSGYSQYYYELWDNSLAVADAPKRDALRIYPNPTSSKLLIEWKGSNNAVPSSYMLSEASGRTALSGELAYRASKAEIDLAALPVGMYVFSAMDQSGKVIHTEKVIRQ